VKPNEWHVQRERVPAVESGFQSTQRTQCTQGESILWANWF